MKINGKNQLIPGIRAIDLGLWVEKAKTLVLADLHLGYEEMLNRHGTMLPRTNFSDIMARIEEKILSNVRPETIVINGDLKHEFGLISNQEWREVIELLEFLEKHCKRIVLVKGNHDNILGPLAKWKGLEIVEEFFIPKEKVLVLHGHRVPNSPGFKGASVLVIGHEHPALSIKEGVKSETSKCFLVGSFKGKKLIVQPSLNSLSIGTDILKGEVLSPLLKQNLGEFETWLVEDKVYYFGKINDLGLA